MGKLLVYVSYILYSPLCAHIIMYIPIPVPFSLQQHLDFRFFLFDLTVCQAITWNFIDSILSNHSHVCMKVKWIHQQWSHHRRRSLCMAARNHWFVTRQITLSRCGRGCLV